MSGGKDGVGERGDPLADAFRDAARWRYLASHWKNAQFHWNRDQSLKRLVITIKTDEGGKTASAIEREIDAAILKATPD
jgi:transposase